MTCVLPPAPPKAQVLQPAPAMQTVDRENTENLPGPSGGNANSEAEEEQSDRQVKSPQRTRAFVRYRFPASIDPFTSEKAPLSLLCHHQQCSSMQY